MSNRLNVAPNDLSAFWMPFTANRQFKQAPRMLVGARDMHYTTADGRKVLDGTAGAGESLIAAVTSYPAFERKKDDKTIRTIWTPAARFVTDLEMRQASLTLDVVPIGLNRAGEAEFQVTYKGAPLAKAEVEIVAQSGWVQTRKTEDDGIFSIVLPWQGSYVIEAKHTDNAAGKRGDEAYDAAMFVTSLSFTLPEGLESPPPPPAAKPN